MEDRKNIIAEYIRCYNEFDIRGMTRDMHDDIVFENKVDGEVDVRTEGLDAFIRQAELAKEYFTERKQTIQSWYFDETKVAINIHYHATLAVNLPNGLEQGDDLELHGTSIFEFRDGKIISLTDMS